MVEKSRLDSDAHIINTAIARSADTLFIPTTSEKRILFIHGIIIPTHTAIIAKPKYPAMPGLSRFSNMYL